MRDNAEFQAWFEGSVVVDDQGRPLRVYHGTEEKIVGGFKPGTFFSASKQEAASYASITDTNGDYTIKYQPVEEWEAEHGKLPDSIWQNWRNSWPLYEDYEGEPFVVVANGNTDRLFYWDGTTSPYGDKNIIILSGVKLSDKDPYDFVYGPTIDDEGIDLQEIPRKLYVCYLSIKKPLELPWNQSNVLGQRLGAHPENVEKEIARYRNAGYDGIKTLSDQGVVYHQVKIQNWIIFDPSQVKILKTVDVEYMGEEKSKAEQLLGIIQESRADRYKAMIPAILRDRSIIEGEILLAIDILKREDRIVWYLRTYFLSTLIYLSTKDKDRGEEYKQAAMKIWSKYFQNADPRPVPGGWAADRLPPYHAMKIELDGALQHFMNLPDPKIQAYQWRWQLPPDLIDDLSKLEEEWKKDRKGFILGDNVSEKATVMVTFDNGWQWVNLNENGCRQEADAMGHCSTCAHSGDVNISLREPVEDRGAKGWKPHLTFCLNIPTGLLSEMKGRFNKKPTPEYHPYIIRLLMLPEVKGIAAVHRGYDPSNDFSMGDLPKEEIRELENKKPSLIPLPDLLKADAIGDLAIELLNANQKLIGRKNKYSLLPPSDPRSKEFFYVSSDVLDSKTYIAQQIERLDNTSFSHINGEYVYSRYTDFEVLDRPEIRSMVLNAWKKQLEASTAREFLHIFHTAPRLIKFNPAAELHDIRLLMSSVYRYQNVNSAYDSKSEPFPMFVFCKRFRELSDDLISELISREIPKYVMKKLYFPDPKKGKAYLLIDKDVVVHSFQYEEEGYEDEEEDEENPAIDYHVPDEEFFSGEDLPDMKEFLQKNTDFVRLFADELLDRLKADETTKQFLISESFQRMKAVMS